MRTFDGLLRAQQSSWISNERGIHENAWMDILHILLRKFRDNSQRIRITRTAKGEEEEVDRAKKQLFKGCMERREELFKEWRRLKAMAEELMRIKGELLELFKEKVANGDMQTWRESETKSKEVEYIGERDQYDDDKFEFEERREQRYIEKEERRKRRAEKKERKKEREEREEREKERGYVNYPHEPGFVINTDVIDEDKCDSSSTLSDSSEESDESDGSFESYETASWEERFVSDPDGCYGYAEYLELLAAGEVDFRSKAGLQGFTGEVGFHSMGDITRMEIRGVLKEANIDPNNWESNEFWEFWKEMSEEEKGKLIVVGCDIDWIDYEIGDEPSDAWLEENDLTKEAPTVDSFHEQGEAKRGAKDRILLRHND